MKNKKHIVMPMLLALLSVATSCEQEELPPAVPDSDVVEVTATIGDAPDTRVSQPEDNVYTFEPNDKIHIVGWTGNWDEYNEPWSDPTDTWWNDAVSTYNGYKWKTEPYMRWQNGDGLQHNFLAWWPENFVKSDQDLTDIEITLTGDYKKDDILVAKWSGTRPDDNTLELKFEHLLSRFDLHLKFGSEYPDAEVVSVEIHFPLTGSCNLLDNNFGSPMIMDSQAHEMQKHPYPTSGYAWSGSCITVPVDVVQNDDFFIIKCRKAGSLHYIYRHPTRIQLKSGERTTLTLHIGKDKVELGEIKAEPWKTEDGGALETE